MEGGGMMGGGNGGWVGRGRRDDGWRRCDKSSRNVHVNYLLIAFIILLSYSS